MKMRPVITVGGIDGCGKTTFAGDLEAACRAHGVAVLLLHVDDFRRKVDWERIDRDEATIYLEDYFDFAAIESCLAAFRNGEPRTRRPLFDERHDADAGYLDVPLDGIDAIVVEGVFARRIPSCATAFQVHLATTFEEARRRIIARRSPPWRTVEEFDYRITCRYFPAQRRYFAEATPDRHAHVLIDNENTQRPHVLRAELDALPPRLRGPLACLLVERLAPRVTPTRSPEHGAAA